MGIWNMNVKQGEDAINKDSTKARCRYCGESYGLDEVHGTESPQHVAARVAVLVQRVMESEPEDNRFNLGLGITQKALELWNVPVS